MAVTCENAIRQLHIDAGDVNAILSTKIYPVRPPQGTARPYAVYRRISNIRDYHMTDSSGLKHTRSQFDYFLTVMDDLISLYNAVRLATDGYRGSVTVDGNVFTFQSLMLDDDSTGIIDPVSGDDRRFATIQLDFLSAY